MPTFQYEALTAGGRRMKGTLDAPSHEEARRLLAGMGLSVESLAKAPPPRPSTPIGRSEFLLFNQQLAAIAKAGIPLERSLRELAGDAASPRMRRLIETIAAELESGTDIREAFEKHGRHFPPLYGRILAAGVASGRLGDMLTSLNRHSETAAQTRRVLFEATAYPLVVLTLAAGIFTGLLLFVVPPFEGIFGEMGRELPAATRALLAMAENVAAIWCGVGLAVAIGIVLKVVLGLDAAGRRFKETIAFSVPVAGRLYRDTVLSRLADAMALLVSSGCDLPAALRLGGGASGSELARSDCEMLAAHVEKGEALLSAAGRCRVLPGLFLYSVELAGQRNELADSLYGLSRMYHEQARACQGRLQVSLLPILILLVGGVVGGAIVALFLPMIHLLRAMQGV